MLECMSRARSDKSSVVAEGKMNQHKIMALMQKDVGSNCFGIASLPSDNIHSIMHNDFNKLYLSSKI